MVALTGFQGTNVLATPDRVRACAAPPRPGCGPRRRPAERDLIAHGVGKLTVDILLIAGLWLDATAWDEVVPALERAGHRPVALTLPGQGDGCASAALDDQVATVLAAVDSAPGRPVVVAHSAACTLAWLAADARPKKVAKVVLIGGFPNADGQAYTDLFELRDGAMPFPGWGPFDGPDSADLDEQTRRSIASAAIPVPQQVAQGVVKLGDERRFEIPVVVVCPEFTPQQAKEWIAAGEVPELTKVKHLEFVDIDSGHWPMFSKPAELARLLTQAAAQD
jgi:pimeloyl-ACP methyl ester carboxylesterase